ncbi:MAG: TPM domain-containing protein [Treponema sp.]|nr:TPM domain-containing protein [Treponema sp.]
MKPKLFLLCLPVILICFSAPLFGLDRAVDNAGLLTSGQAQTLSEMLDRVSKTYNFDLVIVTEKDIGTAKPMDYADDFFDNNGYGLGEDRDGCLFLLVTGSRDYWFSTSGRGIRVYNEAAFNKLESRVLKNLKNDNYNDACLSFVKTSEEFLKLDAKGRSYNYLRYFYLELILISWIIALLTGLIVVARWKKGMNNALSKTEAASYMVPNTLAFKLRKERFLFSTVIRKAKPKSSSSDGGGGSHTSSSGRSHGGRGGKY